MEKITKTQISYIFVMMFNFASFGALTSDPQVGSLFLQIGTVILGCVLTAETFRKREELKKKRIVLALVQKE